MIIPVLRTVESDTTKFDDFSSSNQKNSLNTENIAQQISKTVENSDEKHSKNNEENDNSSKNANKVGFSNIADNLSKMTEMSQVYFQFELDKETKDLIMKVIDKETKEVIQQIPSEMSLKIAQMVEQALGKGQIANATV